MSEKSIKGTTPGIANGWNAAGGKHPKKTGKITPYATVKCPQPTQVVPPFQTNSQEFNRYRRRTWVWVVAVLDCVVAVLICGRFFYYVAKDARISNSPPNSELEDRVSLLWTWFAFLAAYVCQLLMAVGLIIGTRKNIVYANLASDTETILGNCQLWIYGQYVLNLYTMIELLIVVYMIFGVRSIQGSRAILVAVLAIIKIVWRVTAFVIVKLFMKDLSRPTCSCPPQQQQPQQPLQQSAQSQPPPHPHAQQPQMMVAAPLPPSSQYQPAAYHHPT